MYPSKVCTSFKNLKFYNFVSTIQVDTIISLALSFIVRIKDFWIFAHRNKSSPIKSSAFTNKAIVCITTISSSYISLVIEFLL